MKGGVVAEKVDSEVDMLIGKTPSRNTAEMVLLKRRHSNDEMAQPLWTGTKLPASQ